MCASRSNPDRPSTPRERQSMAARSSPPPLNTPGCTPTAGGLTFTGDLAGNLLIFNSKTGDLVRKLQTGGALAGGMITYEIGGKQYLAFTAGNVSRTAWGALGLPSVVIMALDTGHSLQVP